VVNHRKPRVQTSVVSRYPAPAPIDDFVLLFLPPCDSHFSPLATGSLESGLLVSPLLGGPARHRPFAASLHLHQLKSSRNLHLQYSAKSQSTPRCQSLITARSDHPPVLGRSGPQHVPLRSEHRGIIIKIFLWVYLSLTIPGLEPRERRMTIQGMSNQSLCNIESYA
jgi:hypothetical protein